MSLLTDIHLPTSESTPADDLAFLPVPVLDREPLLHIGRPKDHHNYPWYGPDVNPVSRNHRRSELLDMIQEERAFGTPPGSILHTKHTRGASATIKDLYNFVSQARYPLWAV